MIVSCLPLLFISSAFAVITHEMRTHHTVTKTPTSLFILGGFSNPNHTSFAQSYFPIAGHTTHWYSENLLVLFGQTLTNLGPPLKIINPNNKYNTNLISSSSSSSHPEPQSRMHHTSVLSNDTLWVIGGQTSDPTKAFADIWALSISKQRWTHITDLEKPITGHSSIQYKSWLISCFGVTSYMYSNQCTIFDTVQQIMIPTSIIPDKILGLGGIPRARTSTTMSLVNDRIVVFGGQNGDEFMSDVWQLDLKDAPQLAWNHMQSNLVEPRSGHVAVQLNSSLILYHGGQTSLHSLATRHLFLSLPMFTWTASESLEHYTKRSPIAADADNEIVHAYATDREPSANAKSGPGVGMIVGIVVAVLAFVGIAIGLLVWHRHRRVRGRRHPQSRATRFSLSPPPGSRQARYSSASIAPRLSMNSILARQHSAGMEDFLIAKPEMAMTRASIINQAASRPTSLVSHRISSLLDRRQSLATSNPSVGDRRQSLMNSSVSLGLGTGGDRRQSQTILNQLGNNNSNTNTCSSANTNSNTSNMNLSNVPESSEMFVPPHIRGSDLHLPSLDQVCEQASQESLVLGSQHSTTEPDDRTDPPVVSKRRRRESKALKRLTLTIFSNRNSQGEDSPVSGSPSNKFLKRYTIASTPTSESPSPQAPKTSRRSSLFRLLQLPVPAASSASTSAGASSSYPSSASVYNKRSKGSMLDPRPSNVGSIGAKSVASVQWVEFNDAMDYKEQGDSRPVPLSVANPYRRSVFTTRSSLSLESSNHSAHSSCANSPLSSPQSPTFVISPPSHYHLTMLETMSWGDELMQRQRQVQTRDDIPSTTTSKLRITNDEPA
ncbi:hypothetical protein J3Q64DRAFT_1752873 [Phycomyces blakesleeanus]|uniref:Galactose oxidase n=1 Tax=Phycomyces blakesleeanus TaxID=4837 RepID=A0ABR3AV71_PHYBL